MGRSAHVHVIGKHISKHTNYNIDFLILFYYQEKIFENLIFAHRKSYLYPSIIINDFKFGFKVSNMEKG